MSGTSVIKQVPPKDVRAEIRSFIGSVSRVTGPNSLDLIRRSFTIIKALPAAKDAVFEFLGNQLEKPISSYLKELENDSRASVPFIFTGKDDNLVDEIYDGLQGLISPPNGIHWAGFVSKWILDHLGSISSKFARRGRAPMSGVLGDSLHQWMSCRGTRALLDIYVQCFTLLSDVTDEENHINELYEKCVKCSPHLDWAVAHVGCLFPSKIIKTVLEWGLKNHNEENTDKLKLNSLVGILVHLCGTHSQQLKASFWELFEWSLELGDKDSFLSKAGVIPFLMNLAVQSPVLHSTLSSDTMEHLTPEAFLKFKAYGEEWVQQMGGRQMLLDLVVHIILHSEDNVQDILQVLLKTTQDTDTDVRRTAEEILELLVKEMDFSVRVNGARIPLLETVGKSSEWLIPLVLDEHEQIYSTAVTTLLLIGRQDSRVLIKTVAYVLLNSINDDHLASVVKFTQGFSSEEVLSPAVDLALKGGDKAYSEIVWVNISKLLKWETSGTLVSLPMQDAIWRSLHLVADLLITVRDLQTAHLMYEVIWRTIQSSKTQPSVKLMMSIIESSFAYFYICLLFGEGISQLKGVQKINSLLSKLCQGSPVARMMALREFLENSLFRAPAILFGAIPDYGVKLIQPITSLLKDNHKQGTTSLLAHRHSSVFHAGVIGTGKRKATPECPTPPSKVVHNTRLLISALDACVKCESPQGTLDAVILLALLVVQLVSPDIMYNGLPWPDEEFCKVTVERDLHIRRMVEQSPLLWSLLEFIAYHRPALCYCSVLLRALVATVMSQWGISSQQGREAGYNKSLISTTTRVLQLMALSQLLPPPLNVLSDVIPLIPPSQVVIVLRECVWNYMRDHVPSPTMFTRDSNGALWRDPSSSKPPKQYTEALRLVMQQNIATLGALYNTLFVQDEDD